MSSKKVVKKISVSGKAKPSSGKMGWDGFRALIENGSDIIIVADESLNISYTSPSFIHIFGEDPKGFMDTPINEFFIGHVHPDDLDSTLEAYEGCLEKPGNECRAEFRFEHSDGTWHHLVAVGINHFKTSEVNGLVINIRDITEQKKTSEALRESEVRYRRLFEAAKDGILILDAGTGQIEEVNPFLTDLLGYTREEFFGKKVWDLGFFKDIAANEANFLELQEKGYVRYEDMPLETKDGRRINVEFVSNVYLIGKVKVVQCNIRDITERKRHEAEIGNLNSFLLSVRNLNQEIIKAEDFDQLLADSCRILTEIRGYIDVSIAFVNAETGEMLPRAHYGEHGKDSWKCSSECGADVPPCIRKVMGDNSSIILDKEHGICTDCGFCGHEETHQSLLVPMKNKAGELMGIISACLKTGRAIHPQEVPLFEEVAGDLAFAYEKLRGDKALAESEEKYHTLVETMQEGLWVIDENAKTTFVNPAMARMLGYTMDEMLGKSLFNFMDERGVELTQKYLARRRMGISENRESELIRKDGTRMHALLATSPIMGKGGEYRGAIGGVQDITEMRNRNAFINTVLENLSIGVAVNHMDSGKSEYVNPAFCNIYGWPAEELKDVSRFFELVYPDPEYRSELMKRITDDIDSGDPKRMVWKGNVITTKNGEKRIVDARNIPIPEQNLMISTVWDVTDRARAERELETHYDILRMAGKTAKFGGWSADLKTNICTWSDAIADIHEMPHGYSPKMSEDINFYAPEWRHNITKVFNDCATKGIPYDNEMEIITVGGKRVWIRITGEAIRDERENIVMVRGSFQDISARKQLEERLRDHNEKLLETVNLVSKELENTHRTLMKQERLAVLGQMAASVSHELRNPLSVINNVAYYLKSTIPEMDEKTLHMLDLLEREVDRSDRIIGNMLTFSSRKPIIREPMSLNILLQEYFEDTDRVPGNVDLELRLSEDTTVMAADSEKLKQVIDNLVSNACHAMPIGGKLTVSTAIDGDSIVLLVEDTGHGIPQENLSRIFEPLFSTRTTGFGLGLAIVKSLVEDHDGKIEVESELKRGTIFTVTIPRYRGE